MTELNVNSYDVSSYLSAGALDDGSINELQLESAISDYNNANTNNQINGNLDISYSSDIELANDITDKDLNGTTINTITELDEPSLKDKFEAAGIMIISSANGGMYIYAENAEELAAVKAIMAGDNIGYSVDETSKTESEIKDYLENTLTPHFGDNVSKGTGDDYKSMIADSLFQMSFYDEEEGKDVTYSINDANVKYRFLAWLGTDSAQAKQEAVAQNINELTAALSINASNEDIISLCNRYETCGTFGDTILGLNDDQQKEIISAYTQQLEDVESTLGLNNGEDISVIGSDGPQSPTSFIDSSNWSQALDFIEANSIISLSDFGCTTMSELDSKIKADPSVAESVANAISTWVNNNYEYTTDSGENWQSFDSMTATFSSDGKLKGDCEDVANFTANLLYSVGFTDDQVGVYGKSGTDDSPGHIVLGLNTNGTNTNIIDLTKENYNWSSNETLAIQDYDFTYNSTSSDVYTDGDQFVFAHSESDYGQYIAETLGTSIYSIIEMVDSLGAEKMKSVDGVSSSLMETFIDKIDTAKTDAGGNLSETDKNNLALNLVANYCMESAGFFGFVFEKIKEFVDHAIENPVETLIGFAIGAGLTAIGVPSWVGPALTATEALSGENVNPVDDAAAKLAAFLGFGSETPSAESVFGAEAVKSANETVQGVNDTIAKMSSGPTTTNAMGSTVSAASQSYVESIANNYDFGGGGGGSDSGGNGGDSAVGPSGGGGGNGGGTSGPGGDGGGW